MRCVQGAGSVSIAEHFRRFAGVVGFAVTELEHRQIGRDSLFLMADLRLDGVDGEHKVKVRNLSAGGMMAEGNVRVVVGKRLEVNLRNLGWVEGVVAWIQENRFGIAFIEDIDPKVVRATASGPTADELTPRFVRPPLPTHERGRMRKI